MNLNQAKKVSYIDPSELLSRIEKLEKEVAELKSQKPSESKIKWHLSYIEEAQVFTPVYSEEGMKVSKVDADVKSISSFVQFATEEECQKFCKVIEAKAEEVHLSRVCNTDQVKNDTYYKIEWDNNMNNFCINQTMKNAKTASSKYHSYRNAEKALALASDNLKSFLKGELLQ